MTTEHSATEERLARLERAFAIAMAWISTSAASPLGRNEFAAIDAILNGKAATCPDCNGTGENGERPRESLCPTCEGHGYLGVLGSEE